MANDGGLARIQRKMLAIVKAGEIAAYDAMEVGAEEIVTMMRNLVAVDDGDLKASIGWTWGKAPKGAMVIGKVKPASGNATITIFAGNAKAYYARFVEFGTAPHLNGGRFAGSKNPGTSKQPFFYVSYRANRKRVTRRVNTAVRKAVRKVWNGNG
ncbi:HK97-gp10 family putative phage morphogenesis protein [Phyllobacterium sp. YR531]|uniref:HK97-gp10 family putative phage morphogenesis protein n=1 Tax=Phyllobacterium sp. YR531 TaxID=1144343 RepID=UPI00026F5B59|nr:HK97-gp10 family putative phage morphogenesis protein [Phyllobacterium sp. YR531]EJN04477.1 phage protein, HK97 gp10 family [Phyllobacterium sp. YR531]